MRRDSKVPFQPDARCLVPSGAPPWITTELIEDTIRVWQPYYHEPLTPDDAVAMMMNVGELFDAVSEVASP